MDEQHKYLAGILVPRCLIAGDPMVDGRLEALTNLADGLCNRGQPFDAIDLMWQLRGIESPEHQDIVLHTLCKAFVHACTQDINAARALADRMAAAITHERTWSDVQNSAIKIMTKDI